MIVEVIYLSTKKISFQEIRKSENF